MRKRRICGIKRIVLLGSFGNFNVGDDAIFLALVSHIISKLRDNVVIKAYSPTDYLLSTISEKFAKRLVILHSKFETLKAIAQSDFIVVSGGDYLDDFGSLATRIRTVGIFGLLAIYCFATQGRLVAINNGFRAHSTVGCLILKLFSKCCKCISVRDYASYETITKYTDKEIHKGFDTAILLDQKRESHYLPLDSKEIHVGLSFTPVFANFFNEPRLDYLLAEGLSNSLYKILKKEKLIHLTLFSFNSSSSSSDSPIIYHVLRKLSDKFGDRLSFVEYDGNINRYLSKLEEMDAFVCCKYHSIIFAYMNLLPMMIIQYHPKIYAIYDEIGLPNEAILSLKEIADSQLENRLISLLRNAKDYVARFSLSEAKVKAKRGVNSCLEIE